MYKISHLGFPPGSVVKNLPAMQETWVHSLCQKDPLKKGMAAHSRLLSGEFHGERSLADCSPWSHTELDTTERLEHTHTHTDTHTQLVIMEI